MKYIFSIAWYILLFTALIFCTKSIYAQNDFTKLQQSTDSTFGYTTGNPIKLKKGNQAKSIQYTHRFLAGLKTNDNQALTLLSRSSTSYSAYQKPIIQIKDKTTGMPLSGKLGMLDKYVFITANTKDTITIYIDIYNKGELFLPAGLKYE